MAKNNKQLPEPPQPQAQNALPDAPAPRAEEDISKAQIWTFWAGVALAVIITRVLNQTMPGVPERVIERWVMLGFGAFLVAFLLKLK